MKFETKLKRFIKDLERDFVYDYDDFSSLASVQLRALMTISHWVHDNSKYTQEGIRLVWDDGRLRSIGKIDKWVANIAEIIAKSKGGKFRDDCDGYAVLIFLIAQIINIKNLRLAIVFQKIGSDWNTNGHMVNLFSGIRRGWGALLVPSTFFIGDQAISRKNVFKEQGVYVTESFNKTNRWVHKRPLLKG